MRAGSVILPVVLPRIHGGVGVFVHPEITYDPGAPRHEELHRVVMEILKVFEGWIREFPEQWHVLDPVWRSQDELRTGDGRARPGHPQLTRGRR